ncbi:TIGR02234 family membrane protein [Antrihabitans sp. YC2-6]|uniref:TIGR02234 family membrane protein n=1 Tax=Antrihabitans sp. YC2-6 TaxID=2799498 RepID=UPI0018F4F9D5|nr:TIGR02234 family membrane protein [Antrihabitans sp. YC2-6]MBJ8343138.1 TIGR02234 family membrane protein [Antrihabitans sp. YC2-6]
MKGRYPVVAALVLAAAAGCAWGSSKLVWVTVASADGLGVDRVDDVAGSAWSAASLPLALVLCAAIAAVFAVRGVLAGVVAVLIAGVGVGVALPAVVLLTSGTTNEHAGRIAELPGRATVTSVDTALVGPAVAIVGGVAAIAAAVLLLARTRSAGGLSAKYDSPAARRSEAVRATQEAAEQDSDVSQRLMWDALDAGVDPTVESEGGRGTPR